MVADTLSCSLGVLRSPQLGGGALQLGSGDCVQTVWMTSPQREISPTFYLRQNPASFANVKASTMGPKL